MEDSMKCPSCGEMLKMVMAPKKAEDMSSEEMRKQLPVKDEEMEHEQE